MGNHNSGGGNKKSIEEHMRDGTYRKDRHGDLELPQSEQAMPKAEQHITSTKLPTKLSVYKRFAADIDAQGLSNKNDGIVISQLAELYVAYCRVSQLIADEGIEAKIGAKTAIAVSLEVGKEIRAILAEFHLTPSSRRKAGMGGDTIIPEVVEDPVGSFLSKPRLVSND